MDHVFVAVVPLGDGRTVELRGVTTAFVNPLAQEALRERMTDWASTMIIHAAGANAGR